jgi:hypothetical protein
MSDKDQRVKVTDNYKNLLITVCFDEEWVNTTLCCGPTPVGTMEGYNSPALRDYLSNLTKDH